MRFEITAIRGTAAVTAFAVEAGDAAAAAGQALAQGYKVLAVLESRARLKLPRLRRLELVGFGPLYLDALPASLRTLRSFGGQVTEEMMLETEDGAEPFLLTLPDHCRCEAACGAQELMCSRVSRSPDQTDSASHMYCLPLLC